MIFLSKRAFAFLRKVSVLSILLLCLNFYSYGQSCNCEQPDTCAPCQGGLTSLTLRYVGWGIGLRYSVTDDSGNLGNGFLINNTFTVNSRDNNQPFRGGSVTVRVIVIIGNAIIATQTINTSCEDPIFQGDIIGDFEVVAAQSLEGGSICCAESAADNLPPQISNCPSDINMSLSAGCTVPVDWDEPSATDECGIDSFTSSHQPDEDFPVGSTRVTYTARDNAGNESVCFFNVVVIDDIKPVFTSCDNSKIKVDTDGDCNVAVNWSPPEASDNCSLASLTSNYSPGDVFPQGKTTVTYTATDNSGNTATCSFDVQVKVKESEAITGCLDDITLPADGSCGRIVEWEAPETTCSLSLNSNYNSGDRFPLGSTEVIYTAVDEDEVVATCSFTVVVIDESAPVFSTCPSDIFLSKNVGCEVAANWEAPVVTDNCDQEITIQASHTSGEFFPVGLTTVSYLATDEAGLTSTCTFNVVVSEVPALTISNCPDDIIVTGNNNCELMATWDSPLLENTCTNANLFSSHESGDVFPVGTTEVIYTATDDVGNRSTCSFNVIVENGAEPSISKCPSNIKVKATSEGTAKVDWEVPEITVICGSAELTSSHNPGDLFPVGRTEVVYILNSSFNERVTCTFDVIVIEEEFELEVQKIVTPNNDNYNDQWILEGISRFENINVIIIDRWGSQIFKTSSTDNGRVIWDGTYRGNIVPSGTYYYMISLNSGSSVIEKSGFIELIN